MTSRPGGTDQEPHQNFSSETLRNSVKSNGKITVASMLCALSEGSCVRVFDGCFDAEDASKTRIVCILPGYCMIFREDLIRPGMAYQVTDYRFHCYLAYATTEWQSDIVSNVLPTHYKCHYCPEKSTSSSWVCTHRHRSEHNPNGAANREKKRACDNKRGVIKCTGCGKTFDTPRTFRSYVKRIHD